MFLKPSYFPAVSGSDVCLWYREYFMDVLSRRAPPPGSNPHRLRHAVHGCRASETSVVHPPASDLNVLALHSSTPPTLSNPSHRFASSLSSNFSPAVYLIRLSFGVYYYYYYYYAALTRRVSLSSIKWPCLTLLGLRKSISFLTSRVFVPFRYLPTQFSGPRSA